MIWIVMAFMLLVIAALMIFLLRQHRRFNARKTMDQQLQTTPEPKSPEKEPSVNAETIWELTNTIHLCAALTKEESALPSVQEKQEKIMRLSEEILQYLTDAERDG